MRISLDELPGRVTSLLEERKKLERDLSDARKKLAMGGGGSAAASADAVETVGDIKLMARAITGVDVRT